MPFFHSIHGGSRPVSANRCRVVRWIFTYVGFRFARPGVLVNQCGDKSCPARLVACADSPTVIAVKIFGKEDILTPLRIGLNIGIGAVERPVSLRYRAEKARSCRCAKSSAIALSVMIGARTSWTLNGEFVAIVMMEFLQRLDQQEIDREPDRPAPIGVAAK